MNQALKVFLLSLLMSSAHAAEVKVLASVKPLQLIASAITENISSVALLMPVNQSPHHYNLTPSDRNSLEEADLILWIGEELETALSGVLQEMATEKEVIELAKLAGLKLHTPRVSGRSANAHSAGRIDPHLWLDTENALAIAAILADKLSAMDAGNAAEYARNLQRFGDGILELNAWIEQQILSVRGQKFIVDHDALQYFETQFNWPQAFALLNDTETQPGMRHIIATRAAVRETQPRCLFTDISTRPETLTTLLAGYEVRQVELDLLGSDIPTGSHAYRDLMHRLTATVVSCFN